MKARIAALEVARVVVGLPVSLRGGDSAQTIEVREFAERLGRAVRVPVELYDERFTTSFAHQAGGAQLAGLAGGRRAARRVAANAPLVEARLGRVVGG